MSVRLTVYGRRELIISTVAAGATCALLAVAATSLSRLFWPVMVPPIVLWLWVLWFFRDPDRTVPPGDGVFVSPADGQVTDITNVGSDSPLGCEGVKVGVFMSVFDVHVNRCPVAARVERVEHTAGVFLDARDPEAAFRNESATIHLVYTHNGGEYPIVVRQIAGLIARRIITDLKKGQQLAAGERIGMIKFGSRLELFVPVELAGYVPVKPGHRVSAGTSVLVTAGRRRGGER